MESNKTVCQNDGVSLRARWMERRAWKHGTRDLTRRKRVVPRVVVKSSTIYPTSLTTTNATTLTLRRGGWEGVVPGAQEVKPEEVT